MMGYSELHAAADRLIIPEDIRSCLGKSDTRLNEHDLRQVDEYLYHAVVVGLVFADRVARRMVNEKILRNVGAYLRVVSTKRPYSTPKSMYIDSMAMVAMYGRPEAHSRRASKAVQLEFDQ